MSIRGDLCRSGIPADDTNAICQSEVNRCRFAMRKGVAHRPLQCSVEHSAAGRPGAFATDVTR